MTDTCSRRMPRESAKPAAKLSDKTFASNRMRIEHVWRHLEMVSTWKRKNMAFLYLPQGNEVLVWLLKAGTGPRPLKDLYRTSRFSEPTLRGVLKSMVDDRFIVIEPSPDDLRVRTVYLTGKLLDRVQEYLDLLRACSQFPDDELRQLDT